MDTINLKTILSIHLNGYNSDFSCRVCFNHGGKLTNIREQFDINGNFVKGKFSIADMLLAITFKRVHDTDILFNNICESCIEKIIASFLFLKQILCVSNTIEKCIAHLDNRINLFLESDLKEDSLILRLPSADFCEDNISDKTSKREFQRCIKAEENIIKVKHNIEPAADQKQLNHEIGLDAEKNEYFTGKSDEHLILNVTNSNNRDETELKVRTIDSLPESKNFCQKIYECTMCLKTFINCSDYIKHRKEHSPGTKHICKKCNKGFVTSKCLQRHSRTHKDRNDYLCTQCGKYYASIYLYHSHFVSNKELIYKCTVCEKIFHSPRRVREHHNYVHLKKRREYMCDFCGKILLTHNVLLTHLKIHQPVTCDGCSGIFKDKKTYNLHWCKFHKNRNSNLSKKYVCDYCAYESMRKWNLAFHIQDKHIKSHEFYCNICKKKFHRKERLVRHRAIHAQLRPEECEVCGNKFVNKRALLYHTRLHTGEKPFECEICGECFVTKCRRLSHTKRKHMAPTVKCQHCKSLFYSNYTKNQHVNRVHSHVKD